MLYLIIYLLLLLFSLFVYLKKKKQVDGGAALIALYLVYAFFSILLYADKNQGLLYDFNSFKITLLPLLFLFLCLMISFAPVFSFDSSKYIGIKAPNVQYLDIISWVIIFSYVFQIRFIATHLISGISSILLDSDGGADLYNIMAENAKSGGIGISNIFAIIGNLFYDFGVFLLFYYLTREKKNKAIIIGLSIAMFIGILMYLAAGQRGGMIKRSLLVVGTFLLFRRFINAQTRKKIIRIGAVMAAFFALLFMAISVSRFSSREGGVESSFKRYAGQSVLYFDQYAFDNNGIRYGDRVAPVFKRLLLFDNVPRNYVERREKYPNLNINDEVFVTFVGDFCFDFGPVAAFFILLFFSLLCIKTTQFNGSQYPFYKLIIVQFALSVCIQGGALFSLSDLGNLEIILYFFLYVFFRMDYVHQKQFNE